MYIENDDDNKVFNIGFRKYVAETKMIHIPIAEGEFFSDQEMNDYINERKKNDR